MAGKTKKKLKSKFFRVAVEGATCDGRSIERHHIQEMADSYDPQLYGARVWIEHIRSLLPDSAFRAYGDVIALKAEEVEIGGKKKLALFAQIEPTDDLVAMVNDLKQKLYTSIELAEKFADTGKAYMWGLAVTDSPASLGTEMLAFAAQHPDKNPLASRKQDPANLFTAAEECNIEFESMEPAAPRSNGLASFFANLGIGQKPTTEPKEEATPDIDQFAAQILQQFADQESEIGALRTELSEHKARYNQLANKVSALEKTLDETPQGFTQRPPVTGNTGAALAEF